MKNAVLLLCDAVSALLDVSPLPDHSKQSVADLVNEAKEKAEAEGKGKGKG